MVSNISYENSNKTGGFSSLEWLLDKAIKKHKEGSEQEAIAFYLEVIDFPGDRQAWIYGNVVSLLAKVGRVDEAFSLGKKAIEVHPDSDEVCRAFGIVADKYEDEEKSIEYYLRATKLNREQPLWVYYHLTELLAKSGRLDEAVKIGEQGLELNPNSHLMYYYLAEALAANKEWKRAISNYVRCLELTPDYTNAVKGLDIALEQKASISNRNSNQKFAFETLGSSENNIENEFSIQNTKNNSSSGAENIDSSDSKNQEQNILTQSQDTFTVEIDEIAVGGILKGRAINRHKPTQQLKVRIFIDGKPIKTISTTLPDGELEASSIPWQEFALRLPTEILDDGEHKLKLLFPHQDKAKRKSLDFEITLPRRAVGVVDVATNNRLRGWALPDGHIEGSVKLDVYIDDVFFSQIEANAPRPDLLQQQLGNGKNGFDVYLPLLANREYRVAVLFDGTQQHLKRSPLKLIGNLNRRKDSIVAQATEVSLGGILRGWAIDNHQSDRTVQLKVVIDEQPIGVVETQETCIDVNHTFLAAAPKKFAIQLPFDVLDDREHSISLIPLNQAKESLKPISCSMVLPRRGYGVVEGWHDNCVRGWVLPDDPNHSSAILDVYLDGIFYKEVKANNVRRDLIKHGISVKGENGFEISLPIPPDTKQEYKVEVFFKGTKQNLKRSPVTITYEPKALFKQFGRFSQLYGSPRPNIQGITIIIPVYNAYEAVRQCLMSVFKHTTRDAKLIIVNDASPDERVFPMLEKAVADRPNVLLVNNEQNLGYTRTINKGIALAPDDDIVLLNSDTSVGPRWLQNMRSAAYRDLDIGTVTAISDNSGAFSVPKMGQANDFPVWLQSEEIARSITQNSNGIYPETPTGSGFCIYIRRELMNDIGLFDESAFPRGYGEENDFCMRSLCAGWRHVVDDKTLVYHVRSASFQGEKTALYKPGREVVDKRYPEYKALVTHFVNSASMDLMRYQVRKLLETSHTLPAPRPRVLFVISTKTGGTPQTNQDLMTGLGDRYHPMLLICDSKQVSFYDARPKEHILLKEMGLKTPINPTAHNSKEYDNIVGDLLLRYGVELIHIRHIAWHSISLARLAQRLDIPTILSFHDFYTVCPTVNLLDENLTFCAGECTATKGRCPVPIWPEYRLANLKHHFIRTWQNNMAKMFQYIDAFVTTAPSAKEMMTKIYPQLKEANFPVIPHGRDFSHLQSEPTFILRPPKHNKPLRILFPGNISSSKGAELIVKIKQLDVNNRLEFHFLGRTRHFLKPVGILHGTYTREDFDQWMQKIRPHCVGIFSIWPETYCHTLTESWASGIPVVAIDKGAVGERIARHGGGWLINEVDAEAIYQKLIQIADDVPGYIEKISHLNHWQLTYAKQNNIATMAAQYHKLYQQVLNKSRPFESAPAKPKYLRVGVFINPQLPPTAHIRVLEWLKHPLVRDRLDIQMLDIDTFINDENQMFDLDTVLIQRNIIQPHNVRALIDTCRQRNLPIVYEIDDNLLNVPADKDRKGVYAKAAPAIETLAAAASQVIVSTEPLARQMGRFNDRLTVIPNAISESTWLKPLSVDELPPEVSQIPRSTFKILYMGNSSHNEDLAAIEPVFRRLAANKVDLKLLMIGGESEVAENAPDWYTRLSIPEGYERYQQFVPWFRQIAQGCDLAIAPLVDNEFNQYKSPLKYLQYSAVGLPGIYSNCTPYKEIVADGENGILTKNDPDSWYRAISQVQQEREKLKSIAEKAKQLVLDRCLMSNFADVYLNVFELALNTTNQ